MISLRSRSIDRLSGQLLHHLTEAGWHLGQALRMVWLIALTQVLRFAFALNRHFKKRRLASGHESQV